MAKSYKEKFKDEDGVWRTIGGRRVFIREGQSLSDAMKESGKFKTTESGNVRREDVVKVKHELEARRLKQEERENLDNFGKNKYGLGENYWGENYRQAGKWRREEEDLVKNYYDNPQEADTTYDLVGQHINKEQQLSDIGNKYASTKHEGFGDYNDDYIPVYKNEIDYTGDFGRADLSKLSDEELRTALNVQSEEYHNAVNEKLGDQRTRNGKMDKIFNTAKQQKYEEGMKKLNEEINKRDLPRYNIYDDNGMVRVSSPTKEMAEKQLAEMYETDKKLQKAYGWKELPKYSIKEGKVDEYLNERKEVSNLKERFKDTYKDIKETTDMSEEEIIEFLKKIAERTR